MGKHDDVFGCETKGKLDFGTIAVYCCKNSCALPANADVNYAREYVFVQPPI